MKKISLTTVAGYRRLVTDVPWKKGRASWQCYYDCLLGEEISTVIIQRSYLKLCSFFYLRLLVIMHYEFTATKQHMFVYSN
jgi:hypothetical protein